jgi:type I restriction enzyme R subunit
MPLGLTELDIENLAVDWFRSLGYDCAQVVELTPEGERPWRQAITEPALTVPLRAAIARLNPELPASAQDDALRQALRQPTPSLVQNNFRFHQMLTSGVQVEYRRDDGKLVGAFARLIAFDDPQNNEFLVARQYIVRGDKGVLKRADLVVFVNGLPLAVIEFKDPTDEQADIWKAYDQLREYQAEVPALFAFNELLVISDGVETRYGSITSDPDRFSHWKTIDGTPVTAAVSSLEVLIRGMFEKRRLLELVRHFIVFEVDPASTSKKIAQYHQLHATAKAVEATIAASQAGGDRRCGVIWHTQGSGKSLTMLCYAGKLIAAPEMENPTLVLLTDRNDLDNQLLATFGRCKSLLRQDPVQAESREHLRELLNRASGGVIFTTIHKFAPPPGESEQTAISQRRNIVVIADEAHRSQYDFLDGLARHMRDALPGASFIGFTGTPVDLKDANTRAVFGDYIDIYDIKQAVDDHATVNIYYEGRLAKLGLDPKTLPEIDAQFEEVTEGEENVVREKLKRKWATIEMLVGHEDRIKLVARTIVEHFEGRTGPGGIAGKGMIVCMSRRICMDLYDEITRLRPQWHDENDDKGFMKVIMTGDASEGPRVAFHARNKARRERLATKFKDCADPFKLVIVRDMWLTGFDCPSMHTMYLDKPMRGHGLMQAIARVNRVYRDKPGGLVVDLLGIAEPLKEALAQYTSTNRGGIPALDQDEAVDALLAQHEVLKQFFHGFHSSGYGSQDGSQRLITLVAAVEFVLAQEKGKERFLAELAKLSQSFALAVPREEALAIRHDLIFYQDVRAQLVKHTVVTTNPTGAHDSAIKQLVSQAISGGGVVDLFEAAGLKSPSVGILNEDFLREIQAMPQKNLALEALRRLLNDEIKQRGKKNIVESRTFREMLEDVILRYQNMAINAAQVIDAMIQLARQLNESKARGEKLQMNEEEIAFYDALARHESARQVLGDQNLYLIAREVAKSIQSNVSIDWTIKESVRAKLRSAVKRVLRKWGYPPDQQESATDLVLQQAELLCSELSSQ